MDKATIVLKFKVEFIYCGKCSTRPLDLSQSKVERFLKDHAGHATTFGQYPRIVGYLRKPTILKKQKVSVQFLKEKPKCKFKACDNYSKKATDYCTRLCKENARESKKNKKRRNK